MVVASRAWSRVARITLLVLCAALSTLSSRALAGDKAMAESLFQAGRELMAQGKYDEACPKFAESLRVDPAVGAALNLALCHQLQGKTASAWAEYRHAATMARAAGQTEREEGALDRAAKLEPRLSKLTIEAPTPAPGQKILRNGVQVGPGGLGVPIAVDPGSYTIEASAPGFRAWSTTITVGKDGDHQRVVVPALERPAEEEADDEAAPNGESDIAHYALATTATGIGLVGVVLGSVFGVRAMTKWDDAQAECPDAPEYCNAAGVALSEEANDAATVSTVGFVIGGLGLAAATALWLTAPGAPFGPDPSAASATVRVVPLVSDRAAGLSLVGEL